MCASVCLSVWTSRSACTSVRPAFLLFSSACLSVCALRYVALPGRGSRQSACLRQQQHAVCLFPFYDFFLSSHTHTQHSHTENKAKRFTNIQYIHTICIYLLHFSTKIETRHVELWKCWKAPAATLSLQLQLLLLFLLLLLVIKNNI